MMEPMVSLASDEQAEIDEAWHDGEGWAISVGIPTCVRQRLEQKGLIRHRKDRWQLTISGFTYSRMFRAPRHSLPLSGAVDG